MIQMLDFFNELYVNTLCFSILPYTENSTQSYNYIKGLFSALRWIVTQIYNEGFYHDVIFLKSFMKIKNACTSTELYIYTSTRVFYIAFFFCWWSFNLHFKRATTRNNDKTKKSNATKGKIIILTFFFVVISFCRG